MFIQLGSKKTKIKGSFMFVQLGSKKTKTKGSFMFIQLGSKKQKYGKLHVNSDGEQEN